MLSESAAIEGSATDCGSPARAGLAITCEQGDNRIPAPYRDLFRTHQALLDSHRGFDPGALIMARALATAFAALFRATRPWAALRKVLVESLGAALASRCGRISP